MRLEKRGDLKSLNATSFRLLGPMHEKEELQNARS